MAVRGRALQGSGGPREDPGSGRKLKKWKCLFIVEQMSQKEKSSERLWAKSLGAEDPEFRRCSCDDHTTRLHLLGGGMGSPSPWCRWNHPGSFYKYHCQGPTPEMLALR